MSLDTILITQAELQRKLDERDRQINDLRRQLAGKDRVLENQRLVLEEASHTFSPVLRAKVSNLKINKRIKWLFPLYLTHMSKIMLFFFSLIRTWVQSIRGEINIARNCKWPAKLFHHCARTSGKTFIDYQSRNITYLTRPGATIRITTRWTRWSSAWLFYWSALRVPTT